MTYVKEILYVRRKQYRQINETLRSIYIKGIVYVPWRDWIAIAMAISEQEITITNEVMFCCYTLFGTTQTV